LRVVQLPTKREVTGTHLDNLHASALTEETIRLAALYVESHPKRLADLLQVRHWRSTQGNALVFPFYLPGADEPHAYRLRPQTPRMQRRKNGKLRPVKYEQPKDSPQLVYFPPRARVGDWYQDTTRTLYWTEGEKKSLALDQLGLPCVGLTGVWLWLDAAHREERGDQLHPHIAQHVAVAGRRHVIVWDADAREKDDVMQAAARLCGVLYAAGAVDVRFITPPDAHAAKGIDDFYAAHGELAVRALLETAQPLEAADPKQPLPRLRALAALRDAPLSEALRMPAGYTIERDGALWREAEAANDNGKPTRITHAPLYVTRHLTDHYTGEERADLVYPRGEAWQALCVSRRAVADARAMVAEMAPLGAPVTSNNASKLVDWLQALEATNTETLPRVTCVAQTGWHPIGSARTQVFTAHATYQIEADTDAEAAARVDVAIDTRGDRRRMFAALAPRGTLDGHVDALRRAFKADPRCAAMICGAFAAPMLRLLDAPNFAIHLVGESSRGKTSMLKIAASVFGSPNAPGWLASWNVSLAAAEIRAAQLNDLPQCYDEIGSSGEPGTVEAMVYGLVNGHGRNRATREYAMRESLAWRTVVLSTGEHELAPDAAATGAQVRVVQLPIDGFGKFTAPQVDALVAAAAANSGSAGAEWLQHLVNMQGDADALAQTHQTIITNFREGTKGNLQGRAARYFAVLGTVESLLADAFDIGSRNGATMRELWSAHMDHAEAPRELHERAYDAICDWVMSNPEAFPMLEMGSSGDESEPRKARGVRYGFQRSDGVILIIPSEFRRFCRDSRLSERPVLRELLRLGLAEASPGRLQKRVRVGNTTPLFVYILRNQTTSSSAP
jgi:hypothetical protein